MADLTAVEAELAEAVGKGHRLDLSRRKDRVVRAGVIRDLVRDEKTDPRGVMLVGARITGELDLDMVQADVPLALVRCAFDEGPSLFQTEIPAVYLDGSTMPGLFAKGLRTKYFRMADARLTATLDLENARVDGTVFLSGASVRTGDAVAFSGDGMQINGDLWMSDAFLESNSDDSTLMLFGCDIGGALLLHGSVVTNSHGHGIQLERARIAGSLQLKNGFVSGAGDAIRMIGASIGRQLNLNGTVLRAADGNAVCADDAHVSSTVILEDGFDAASSSSDWTIRMVSGRTGDFSVKNATIRNRRGQAVTLNKAKIDESVYVHGATIEGNGSDAVFDLNSADVGSQLSFIDARIVNHGDGLDVDLFHTKVGRSLRFPVAELTSRRDFEVTLNGLSYPEPPIGRGDWLTLLTEHVSEYEAQPYQQLAKVHRAAGHEQLARKILIAQQDDLRKRGELGGRRAKAWHWFLGKTLGYGYLPSRAVAGLVTTFIAGIALVIAASWTGGTQPAKDRGPDACSLVNRVSLAADLAIPLVKLGGQPRCEFNNTTRGQWFTAGGWMIQILGWSFATLSVAGFTGLVRRT